MRLILGRGMQSAAQACWRAGLQPATCETGCSSGAADSKASTREMVELQVRCYTISSRSSDVDADVDVQVSAAAESHIFPGRAPAIADREGLGDPNVGRGDCVCRTWYL